MVKYKTESVRWNVNPIIQEVEIDRETESSIWINGWRRNKTSNYDRFFDTWEDAHEFLLKAANNNHDKELKAYQRAQADLKAVKAMKK